MGCGGGGQGKGGRLVEETDMQSARVTEKEENKKTRASRTKTPVRKADLARDPGGVGGGGEGAREREQGKTETETCSQETDRHTDRKTLKGSEAGKS